MSSSLFGNQNQNNILQLVGAIKSGNANALFSQMLQSNPQFRQFVESTRGKSAEQIAQENGIDLNSVLSLLR